MSRSYTRHYEEQRIIPAAQQGVFEFADDPIKLASHMGESSSMMAGGKMSIEVDTGQGREVGSVIRMTGRVLGLNVGLEERVTERDPPNHKAWETIGTPSLLVIGSYRLGFDMSPEPTGTQMRVYIDYDLGKGVLGRLLGRTYAKWCVRQMLKDTARHFRTP